MREERLRLADTYLALADVSCETGTSISNFLRRIIDQGLMYRKLPTGSSRLHFCS